MHRSLTSAAVFAAVAIMTGCNQSNPPNTVVVPRSSIEAQPLSARPAQSPSPSASVPSAETSDQSVRVRPPASQDRRRHRSRTASAKAARADNPSPSSLRVREFVRNLQGMSTTEHLAWAEKELAARNIETDESPQNATAPATVVRSATSQIPETGSVKAPK
jgi:hypothetical protein